MSQATSGMKLSQVPEQGELDQQQQAYLNALLQEESPSIGNIIRRSKSPNNHVVELYLMKSIDKIQKELDGGKLELANTPHKPIGKSRERVMQFEMKKKLLEKELGYLDTQIRSYPDGAEQPAEPATQQLSKQEHKKLIRKMFKLHQQYEQLHQKNLAQMEGKKQEEQSKKKQELQQQRKKEQEQKRKRLEDSLKMLKDQQEKRSKLQEESNARVEEIKHKKFLHQRMQERYEKEVVLPTLELKKKKLREIRQFRRPLSIEQLKTHQQEYSKKKAEHAHEQKKPDTVKYEPPAKSSRLEKLLEQEELERQKAEQQKKRQLEQKMERAESYVLYLKQNFKPRIDEQKKREIQERLLKEKSRSREDRGNTKMIGLGYLEYSKQRHKIISQERNATPQTYRQHTNEAANISYQSKNSITTKPYNYLTTRDRKDYDQQRKRKLQRIIENKQMNRADKVKQLKAHADLLTQMANRKNQLLKIKPNEENESEATQLLLASIRAKMGIIDIYKVNEKD